MNSEELTQAELKQRQQAARKHGTYAIRDRGEQAMTAAQRGAYAELKEQLDTRQGTVEAMKDAAINTVILAQVAQNYCVGEHQAGKPLGDIPLLRNLPQFWNAAGRALKAYLDCLPDDHEILDLAAHIKKQIGGDDEQSS